MSEFRAAHRYALALIGTAGEMNVVDEVDRDLRSIDRLIRESREFGLFLRTPLIMTEKKKRVIGDLLRGTVGGLTMKFVVLLASKGREGLLPRIIEEFQHLRDERMGILPVTVRAALSFDPSQEQSLVRRLEEATKKKVRLTFVQDPSLRGGFSVQHRDTVWDASVRHQLELLRRRFVEGNAG